MSTSALHVTTPERVAVELPLAGVGSRAMAYLIDAGLLLAAGLVLYFGATFLVADPLNAALALPSGVRVAAALLAFAAVQGYWTLLEALWRGQTPGKRMMRLRVVRADGQPLRLTDCALRNLLRAVDFLPMCYPVGLLVMLFDARHRRLGDMVAGTLLVREDVVDLSRFDRAAPRRPLSATELDVVTDLLRRFDALDPAARRALGQQLLTRLGATDGAPLADLDDGALRARLEALVEG